MDSRKSTATDAVLVALRRIARTIDLRSRDLMRRYGLTVPQLVVLRELERGGEHTGSSLARVASLSQATITGILQRLEARGLVERHRSDADKRQIGVRLTVPGHRLVADAPSPLQSRFSHRLESLADWEQSMILAALQRLVALMEAEDLDAGPYLATGAADGTVFTEVVAEVPEALEEIRRSAALVEAGAVE
jgi:DNA-binding MarR family transcriptional regulator